MKLANIIEFISTNWQYVALGLGLILSIIAINDLYFYDKGKNEVYREIAATPVKTTVKIIHDTIPAPPSVIKRLKADTVFQTPDSLSRFINGLSDSCIVLKKLLAEKLRPWEISMDSTRFYLYVLVHPWERIGDVTIKIKPVPYQYNEKTNSQIIIKDSPWWYDVLKIGGGALAGYGASRIGH